MGPSIKYVMLFLANFDSLPPPVILCHTSRDPPKVRHTSRTPRFFEGLVQKTRTKAPCTNSLSIVRRGLCPGIFCLKGFVRGGFCPFPLLSEYIDLLQQKVKHHFRFHVSYVC